MPKFNGISFFIFLLLLFRIRKPKMFPSADILPLYRLLASGISSPVTTYNIAPAAKLRQIAIIVCDTFPYYASKESSVCLLLFQIGLREGLLCLASFLRFSLVQPSIFLLVDVKSDCLGQKNYLVF